MRKFNTIIVVLAICLIALTVLSLSPNANSPIDPIYYIFGLMILGGFGGGYAIARLEQIDKRRKYKNTNTFGLPPVHKRVKPSGVNPVRGFVQTKKEANPKYW